MKMELSFKKASGTEITPYLEELGQLRIQVFAEWPYLYDGDLEYEKNYLKTYVQSPHSFIFMVFDGQRLIGATTAIALSDETPEFQKPFIDHNISIHDVIYFGESILLKSYRGHGIGKRFMTERLNFAKSFANARLAAFCAVQRNSNDPRRPSDSNPLDEFWLSQGFAPQDGMLAEYEWKDIGESKPTVKHLQFWIKTL